MTLLCGALLTTHAVAQATWASDSAVTPKLQFARSNDLLTLSWRISPFDFALTSQGSLPGTNNGFWWSTNQTFVGDEARVTIPMTNDQQFFRLSKARPPAGSAQVNLFQFGIFSGLNLELGFASPATVIGPVHGNANIYLTPESSLSFQSRVTAAGMIFRTNAPGDPRGPASGTVDYLGGYASNSLSLILPIGMSNSPAALRQILDAPPVGESPNSDLGRQRLYNQADLVATVSDAATTITSGLVNNKGTTISLTGVPTTQNWLSTGQLYNRREAKTVKTVVIDIANLVRWSAGTNNTLPFRVGTASREVTILHVDDKRTVVSGNQPGVVVKNGSGLPPFGLTVVTPDPLYVHGNYNVRDNLTSPMFLNTADTTHTKPAALMGDSITVLSQGWDLYSTGYGSRAWSDRTASATTVNAAFLAGIVETTSGHYSGGLENFPRFLENWDNINFWYNGSMVVMFPSQIATGLWQGSGETIGIYNPPLRKWSFDFNFNDPSKLPPSAPVVGVLAQPF